MNRCQRNNNPGNLRFAKQYEATGEDDKGFAIFPSASAGFRALHRQIDLDKTRKLTLREFVQKYAPANENNTSNYLNFMCTQLGCKEETMLSFLSVYCIAGCIASMEGFYREEKK